MALLNPTEFKITGSDGIERTFLLGDVPYLDGAREIGSQFISSAMPKLGDYALNESLSRKMYKHVAVLDANGNEIQLKTDALVNNHVPDFLTGIKIEEAMLEKIVGFSVTGKLQEFRQKWNEDSAGLITKMGTMFLKSLRAKD